MYTYVPILKHIHTHTPTPFDSETDYIDALKAHHAVMVKAMKAKQTVDVAACGALEHAVGDFSKM